MDKKIYMKNAFITGGLGFIGSELAKYLIKNKIVNRCIILDNFGSFINPLKSNFKDYRQQRLDNLKNILIERGDASNEQIVLNILQKHKPEYIYHTAALPLAKIDNLNAKEASIGSVDSKDIHPNKISLKINNILCFKNGNAIDNGSAKLKKSMTKNSIELSIDLNNGKFDQVIYFSDLSHDYVNINSEYTS